MKKRALTVGHCAYDHGQLQRLVERAGAELLQAHTASEAFSALRNQEFQLVLVNRKFEADGANGLDFIRKIRELPEFNGLPLMLVSNFADAQQAACAAGAEPGFGKASLNAPETQELLRKYLR